MELAKILNFFRKPIVKLNRSTNRRLYTNAPMVARDSGELQPIDCP